MPPSHLLTCNLFYAHLVHSKVPHFPKWTLHFSTHCFWKRSYRKKARLYELFGDVLFCHWFYLKSLYHNICSARVLLTKRMNDKWLKSAFTESLLILILFDTVCFHPGMFYDLESTEMCLISLIHNLIFVMRKILFIKSQELNALGN